MIYRILVDYETAKSHWLAAERKWNFQLAGYRDWPRTLQGAGSCLGGTMFAAALPAPKVTNPRARFYFTERGWDQVGRLVVEAARQAGHVVKVIRRKNPDPSQIVYQDAWQLAILPRKAPHARDLRRRVDIHST